MTSRLRNSNYDLALTCLDGMLCVLNYYSVMCFEIQFIILYWLINPYLAMWYKDNLCVFSILRIHHELFINLDYEHSIGWYPSCQGYLAACYLSISKKPHESFFSYLFFWCQCLILCKEHLLYSYDDILFSAFPSSQLYVYLVQ